MASRINADSSNGLQLVSDSSGEVQIQSNGVTVATVNSSGITASGADCVFLGSATASSSASIEFTGLNSNVYKHYRVLIDGFVPVTNAQSIGMQLSSGGSFVTSGYWWQNFRWTTSASAARGNTSDDRIYLEAYGADNSTNNATYGGGGWTVDILDANQSTVQQKVVYSGGYFGSTLLGVSGTGRGATGQIDAIKFIVSSGNIAQGRFYLYGFKE